MAQDFSFDVTCGYDKQEFANSIDQARREVATRYDFKGVMVEIDINDKEMTLHTESDYKLQALLDMIESKMVKRNVPLSVLDKTKPVEEASGNTIRQKIGLITTLTPEQTKEITKKLRAELPKVKTIIQGESIRVSSRSKDELQEAIQLLRKEFAHLPLQFANYH